MEFLFIKQIEIGIAINYIKNIKLKSEIVNALTRGNFIVS